MVGESQPPGKRDRADEELREPRALVSVGDSAFAQLVLGTVPWAGGVGALLSNVAAKRQQARLIEFLEALVHDVHNLEIDTGDLLDREFLASEEFIGILSNVSEEVARSGDSSRLKYLRRFLRNSAAQRRPDATWIDLFLRYLPSLSGVHMQILYSIYQKQKGYTAGDRVGSKRLRNVPLSARDLELNVHGENLLRIGLIDLGNLGLLADWRLLSGVGSAQEEYSMTRSGLLFMRFIQSEWVGHPGDSPID